MTDAAQDVSGWRAPTLLLAHGNVKVRQQVAQGLRQGECAVEEVGDGLWAIRQLASRMLRAGRPYDGVILHRDLRGWSGLQILDGLRGSDWSAPTIFLVEVGDTRTAVAARRRGAAAIIEWPVDIGDVRATVLDIVTGGPHSGVRLKPVPTAGDE